MFDFFKGVVFGLERGDFMSLVVDFLVEFLDFLGLEFWFLLKDGVFSWDLLKSLFLLRLEFSEFTNLLFFLSQVFQDIPLVDWRPHLSPCLQLNFWEQRLVNAVSIRSYLHRSLVFRIISDLILLNDKLLSLDYILQIFQKDWIVLSLFLDYEFLLHKLFVVDIRQRLIAS